MFSSKTESKFCIGFEESYENLLGAIFLRNFDILYDSDSKSLKFARARCDDSTIIGSFEDFNRHTLTKKPSLEEERRLKQMKLYLQKIK